MRILGWIGLCALLALPGGAIGQQIPEQEQPSAPELPSRTIQTPADAKPLTAPILTVDQDVLFATSDWGNRDCPKSGFHFRVRCFNDPFRLQEAATGPHE